MDYEAIRTKLGYEYRPEIMKDKIKRFKTVSLFFEQMQEMNGEAAFSIKGYDNKGYKSMRKMYVELEDPTEYLPAMVLLGSWEHWKKLTAAKWFVEGHLNEWREEVEVKLKSKAIAKMKASDTPTATKYLADNGWKDAGKQGRPTVKSIERKARIKAKVLHSVDNHAEILGIKE